jgi:hypothetical protein
MGVYGFHESTLLGKKLGTPTEEEIAENIEFLWILMAATNNITLSMSTERCKIFIFCFLKSVKYNHFFPGSVNPYLGALNHGHCA